MSKLDLINKIGVVLEDLYEEVAFQELFEKLPVEALNDVLTSLVSVITVVENNTNYKHDGFFYDGQPRMAQIL